jgi:EAL and modified HD-GYP domain-containing signal transduction protein
MSLMPVLLETPMSEILEQLPVAPKVKQALLDQDGLLGLLLRLAQATEQTDPKVIENALGDVPGITVEFLGDCLRQAFYWANNLGQEKTNAA